MPVRHEEELSAEALKKHLNLEFGLQSSWSGVEPDPPDLRFEVVRKDGSTETWGVEVTGLIQYIEWEGKEVNRRVFEPAIFKMVRQLNDELGPQMTSGYFLNITGPLDAEVFRDLKRRIRDYVTSGKTEETALDYQEAIASVKKEITTKHDDPAVRRVIEQVAQDRFRVTMKASPGGIGIIAFSGISGVARIPDSGSSVGNDQPNFAADVEATLNYATKRILNAKLPRMANVVGYDKKVLLVWSGIPFVDSSNVANAFRSQKHDEIDGIFLAEFFGSENVTLLINEGLGL